MREGGRVMEVNPTPNLLWFTINVYIKLYVNYM